MPRPLAPAVAAGLVGGSLLFVHGLFPDTHAYPLVWPLLAGAIALWVTAGRPASHGLARGVAAAGSAGVLAGVLALPVRWAWGARSAGVR